MMKQSTGRTSRLLVRLGGVALVMTLGTSTAFAGGYDMPGNGGARGVGRAGAFAVRTDSVMALQLNPANLARLSGVNAEVNLSIVALNLCFDRLGTPTRDGNGELRANETDDAPGVVGGNGNHTDAFGAPSGYANIEYPEVCNGGGILPIPQVALTFRPHERVGVGIGIVAPNNAGSRSFGTASGENIGSYEVEGAPTGRLPTATRYDMISADLLLATLVAGVGVELHPRLRLGASVGWGFANLDFTTAVAVLPDEDAARDILTNATGTDFFVPRIALSLAAEPVDGLEMMANFVWTQNVVSTGDLRMQPIFWGNVDAQLVRPRADLGDSWRDVSYPVEITAPQTSILTFGARYAMARPGARTTSERVAGVSAPPVPEGEVSRPFDPMRDEVFDVELDVNVTFSNRVARYDTVSQEVEGQLLVTGPITLTAPPPISLEHQWKTQVSVSLGGDINVLPETLALRWGLVYESHGVEPGFERLDFTPWQLMGGSLGMTARVKRFELSVGYLFIHYFDIENTEGENSERPARLEAPVAFPPGPIINGGTFTANAHILSLGLSYRFR